MTPPVVGSVSTEMYGRRTSSSRASAAETLAICIRLSVPSIMRAPPEQETITSGSLRSMARSIGARHFLADHRAHRAADEAELHRAAHHGAPGEQAFGGDDGVGTCRSLRRASLRRVGVGLGVHEMQRIVRGELRVVLDPAAVEQQLQPLPRVQAEMVLALGADASVALEVFLPDDGAATGALGPQAFGLDAPLVGRRGLLDRFFAALEPGHGNFVVRTLVRGRQIANRQ